jgi:group II intron reverse transcriptase/maturase
VWLRQHLQVLLLLSTRHRQSGRPVFLLLCSFFEEKLIVSGIIKPDNDAKKWAAKLLDLKWVSRHRGTPDDFITRHRRQARRMLGLGRAGIEKIAPALLRRISDERCSKVAWDYLSANGGQAPGPDGFRYDDFDEEDVWHECRQLRDQIRSRKYQPGDESVTWIPKASGRGKRPLVLQGIFDRVVQRACVEVLQPLLDPMFDARSFGYRPKKSHLHALALASRLASKQGRWVWVTVDLKDAFTSVPLKRLLGIVKKYLPDDELVRFLKTVVTSEKVKGLRQGGPLSPLLLNVFLHDHLDRKWRASQPDVPHARYADDLLLVCESPEEAAQAYDDVKELLRPTGMVIKESKDEAIKDLTKGCPAEYLGFKIRKAKGKERLTYGLSSKAWDGLYESFRLAQDTDDPGYQAVLALTGWIGARGPSYRSLDHDHAYARVKNLAKKAGFAQLPSPRRVKQVWRAAHARWRKLCEGVKPEAALT